MLVVIAHETVLPTQLSFARGFDYGARLMPALKPAYSVDCLGNQFQLFRFNTDTGDEAVMTT
jgi:hypothetical protein